MVVIHGAKSLTDALAKALTDQQDLIKPDPVINPAIPSATNHPIKIVPIPVTPANCKANHEKATNALDAAASIQLSIGCALATIVSELKAVVNALAH